MYFLSFETSGPVYGLAEPALHEVERERVRVEPEARDHPGRDRGNDARVPELLARVRIAQVHLNKDESRARHELGRVAQSVGVVREGGGIEDDRSRCIHRFVQPVDELGLVIGLAQVDREGTGIRLQSSSEVVERAAAVDVGFATAEATEVGTVEHENALCGELAHGIECTGDPGGTRCSLPWLYGRDSATSTAPNPMRMPPVTRSIQRVTRADDNHALA